MELIVKEIDNKLDLKNLKDINDIKNNTEIEVLNIQNDENIIPENMQVLEKFNKLKRVNIKNIKNIYKYIKALDTIEYLNLENCGIEKVDVFDKYNSLKTLKIDDNPIDEEELENIMKLRQKKEIYNLSFMGSAAYEKAINTVFENENSKLEEKGRKILKLYGNNPINLYNIIDRPNVRLKSIEDIVVLKKLGIFRDEYKNIK